MRFPTATTPTQITILGLIAGLEEEQQRDFINSCDALAVLLAPYVPTKATKPTDDNAARCLALAFAVDNILRDLENIAP